MKSGFRRSLARSCQTSGAQWQIKGELLIALLPIPLGSKTSKKASLLKITLVWSSVDWTVQLVKGKQLWASQTVLNILLFMSLPTTQNVNAFVC